MTASRGIRVRRGTRQKWLAENQGKHICGCGCGKPIPLRADHFNAGVPRYLHGHNAKASPPQPRKQRPAPLPCECGCGGWAASGRRFISGHNQRGVRRSQITKQKLSEQKRGALNPRFGKIAANSNGGRYINTGGYVVVLSPDHPYATNPAHYVLEHRLVAEAHLRDTEPESEWLETVDGRRYLRREACVHHVNGDKLDNRVENLLVMSPTEHARLHLRERWG